MPDLGFRFLCSLRVGSCGAGLALLLGAALVVTARPAAAFDLFGDLFAGHRVTAQFATPAGRPLAGAAVRVFAPGQPSEPVATGRTDAQGKFVFDADRDGMWSVEARTADRIERIMIRVGDRPLPHNRLIVPITLGALAAIAVASFWYRVRRARRQHQQKPPSP